MILLASCAPQQNPSSSPTQSSSATTSSPDANANNAVQPVSLITPDVGSTMPWVDGSTLIYVPAGDFIMGDDGQDNLKHTVTLDGFWIYQAKVTNREYSLCVGVGKCQPPINPQSTKDLSDPTLLDHPVTGVNWSQSQTYCGWVQGHLPTEAQWEKTARGPQGNIYPWGDAKPDTTLLNFNENIGATSKVSDFTKGQSYYGGLDMEGNVFEWAADWYKADYYSTSPQKNPIGPDTGDTRSVRSSSFSSTVDQVPTYMRFFFTPDKNRPDLGFRCVVDRPTAFAPYCETSQVAGPPSCPSPTASANPICRGGTVNGTGGSVITVTGGAIKTVSGTKPLVCAVVNGQKAYCEGPASSSDFTGTVTVCAQGCTGVLFCPAGYKPMLSREGPPTCVKDINGPVSIAGVPSGGVGSASRGNDNTNGNGNTNSNNNSNGSPINQISPVNAPVLCIVGTYYDKASNSCKPLSNGTPNQCAPGYTFNQGCCQAPAGAQYPGCGPNEYFDPASQTCVAIGQPSSGSCTTLSVTTGTCNTGGNNSCQPPPGGCPGTLAPGKWNPATCSCQ